MSGIERKSDTTIGKWFEKRTYDELSRARLTHRAFFARFQDAGAAGKFLPNTPSDFLVGYAGQAMLVECKASTRHETLLDCMGLIDPAQAAYHREWHVAGLRSIFLFYSDVLGVVERWDGAELLSARLVAPHPEICVLDKWGDVFHQWLLPQHPIPPGDE